MKQKIYFVVNPISGVNRNPKKFASGSRKYSKILNISIKLNLPVGQGMERNWRERPLTSNTIW